MPPAPTTALTGEMRWLSADRHAGDEALESGARVPRRKREYSVNVTGVCSIAGVRMPCMHPRIRVSLLAAETRPLHEVKAQHQADEQAHFARSPLAPSAAHPSKRLTSPRLTSPPKSDRPLRASPSPARRSQIHNSHGQSATCGDACLGTAIQQFSPPTNTSPPTTRIHKAATTQHSDARQSRLLLAYSVATSPFRIPRLTSSFSLFLLLMS
ncbi:hypothetical protein PCL_11918 [Purpureocillium lilacinum]|uniref:Uncharacterized protein n=1 Tax=Purpureocillium lilacinum TaxID=33203 RepID=A0A2U3EBC0_PURLI|nr:hypothetical protein PCL_11918 [Purpureocillium lilacinum]